MNFRRNLTPTSTTELDMLFDQYLAMADAILAKREFSPTKGNVAEWQRWAFYATHDGNKLSVEEWQQRLGEK